MAYHDGRDNFCRECDRSFINANAFKQHLQSSTHRPRNIKCPFKDLGCESKDFISIAALARHFDANGCTLITRRRFNGIAYDLNQARDLNQYSFIEPDVDPRYWKMGITKYLVHFYTMGAAHKVTNGEDDFWTCTYEDCGAKFIDKDRLKAHLKSPTHEALMYRCPGCDKHFPNLGSACSHIAEDLQGCHLNVGAEMRQVRELITAITQRQDLRARSLERRLVLPPRRLPPPPTHS